MLAHPSTFQKTTRNEVFPSGGVAAEGVFGLAYRQDHPDPMAATVAGHAFCKFFPAGAAGGLPLLKAWAGPFADVAFCPTGGVSLENAPDYLAQPNVICVGGSWVAPMEAVRAGDWGRITELARAASQLGKAA